MDSLWLASAAQLWVRFDDQTLRTGSCVAFRLWEIYRRSHPPCLLEAIVDFKGRITLKSNTGVTRIHVMSALNQWSPEVTVQHGYDKLTHTRTDSERLHVSWGNIWFGGMEPEARRLVILHRWLRRVSNGSQRRCGTGSGALVNESVCSHTAKWTRGAK